MQCNSKLCYIFIFLRQYSKIIYFISEIVTVTGLLGLYYVTMSSINKTNCGRRKGLTEPRRKVKCPVSECEYTGRIDNTKAHLRSLIVWSNRYEGEAAEQDETRYHFEDILKDKDLLDSQDFYKHVMQERGSRKYGMKTIVETLANDDLKCFYGMNSHSALGDAETLCLLSHSKSLGARFNSWVVGFQSLVGSSPIPMVKRKTQSVQ